MIRESVSIEIVTLCQWESKNEDFVLSSEVISVIWANARNISSRIRFEIQERGSFLWPHYLINSVDKTKYF